MSFWDSIVGGGVKGVLEGVGSLAKDIRTAITGQDPLTAEQRAKLLEQVNGMEAAADAAAAQYDQTQLAGQLDINKIEAASNSTFKSGWRPAFGWLGVLGYSYVFLVRPLLPWCIQVGGMIFGHHADVPALPDVDLGELATITLGVLGLGGMRSYDKRQRLQAGQVN